MPSSKNYKRNYVQERLAEAPHRVKDREMRNKARSIMEKEGKAKVGDGKDVGHVKAISKGGKTTLANLAMQTPAENRSFKRNSGGKLVSETSKKEASRRGKK